MKGIMSKQKHIPFIDFCAVVFKSMIAYTEEMNAYVNNYNETYID